MGKIIRRIRKIIPREVRPAVPFAAAYFGGPALGAKLGIQGELARNVAGKALTAALTSKAQGDDTDIALRSAALAAAPDVLQSGLGTIGSKLTPQTTQALKASLPELPVTVGGELVAAANQTVPLSQQLGNLATAASESDLITSLVSPKGQTLGAQAKALAIPTAIEGGAQLAEIQQDQIDAYNRQLQEQGVMNKVKRRQSIFDIYINAGYEPDYVNSVLDKYGYADGGIAYLANGGLEADAEKMLERFSTGFRNYKGKMEPMKALFRKKKKDRKPEVIETEKGQIVFNLPSEDEDRGFKDALMTAREGIEMAYKTPGPAPTPFMKFAKGGEVEIEEETEDLGIMDFMKDQGIPYGEQASYGYNEAMSDTFDMYKDMKRNGLIPPTMSFDEFLQEVVPEMGSRRKEGIMQMASGYKTDIEEMYEQYVFEMEEMGLQPMSFSEFVARERAGMAGGGMMRGPDYFLERINELMDQGYGYEEASEIAYNEGLGDRYKDGGKVKRRKKGEPMDDDGKKPGSRLFPKVPKGEFFLDKMPKPKRREGILEAADGGEVSIGQIEMLIKRGADNDLIKTYVEGAQDGVIDQIREAMDKRKNKKDGGIMEKDMRGGGFIPEGSKERADDVPARLSKNEFVMTADAVRAAGGGSVNKGAKRMYDLMYSLEGKI